MGNAASQDDSPGALVNMEKQDPTVDGMCACPVWIPTGVTVGTYTMPITNEVMATLETEDVMVTGFGDLPPVGEDGNYLHPLDTLVGIGASCMMTVQMVLTMYRRALKRMGIEKPLDWQSGKKILVVPTDPDVPESSVAFYTRATNLNMGFEHNLITCGVFVDKKDPSKVINAGASFDIVAHETGHAILDGLRPDYEESMMTNPQTGALSEALGDISVIFAQLAQMDICERVICASKGDLHRDTFFVKLAEQVSVRLLDMDYLRNADNDLALDEVTAEAHDISQVFTGAVYDILADIYDEDFDLELTSPAETLYKTAQHLLEIVLTAFLWSESSAPNLIDIARSMIQAAPKPHHKAIIRKQFEKRKVFDPNVQPKPVVTEPPESGEGSEEAKATKKRGKVVKKKLRTCVSGDEHKKILMKMKNKCS